ncbi:hypothetical protein CEXT_802981 [Caerostris extrusa]|uniref:Uncharacterized protein n=1 Tax=Caerostris extrusa TaxID=172846 RepID=A0AAV4M9H3_CAEEX|nr:hypothetical protein CEXT_802981 [Caerostris extrusa]
MISNSMPLCDRRFKESRGVKFAPICRLTGDFVELFVWPELKKSKSNFLLKSKFPLSLKYRTSSLSTPDWSG